MKRLIITFICLLIIVISCTSVFGASHNLMGCTVCQNGSTHLGHSAMLVQEGFVISNDGVRLFENGICTNYYGTSVIEVHTSTKPIINYANYNTFSAGYEFLGYFRPNNYDNNGISQLLTSNQKSALIATAANFYSSVRHGHDISYNLLNQIGHSITSGTVGIGNITTLRCDGFIEYLYEKNGIRISGDDNNWNISIAGNKSWHNNSININPKIQAYEYMTNMLGDVDSNGVVDINDARLVLRMAIELETVDFYQEKTADVDGDGDVDIDDAQIVLQYSIQSITIFPGDPSLTNPALY